MDIELSGRIGQLLNELVESVLPKETEASVLVKYKSYVSRILSSRIGGDAADPEETIVSRLKEQAHDIAAMNLKNDNWGLRRGERLQECLTRLAKLKSLKNRSGVLKLICLLSSNKNASSIKAPMFLKTPSKSIQEVILRNNQQLSRTKEPAGRELDLLKTEDVKKTIVRELLFTFQGIESSRLQFNKARDCYEIDPKVDLEKNDREMLLRLCELGVLYQRIKDYLDFQAVQIKGLISQSLSFAIKEELNEYYRFIATLENMRDSSQEFGSLTLKSLYLWTIDPIECLRWILILCDVCRVLKGGQILSALFSYSVHGCPDVESLVNRLITKSLAPFMNFLKNWVYHGELVDPMGEFFILLNKKELLPEQVWADKFRLNAEMIPNFISSSIAEKILNTGKSKTYLRKYCNSQSSLTADFITVENLISFRFMEGLKFRALENWVQSVHREANLKLKEVIVKDFDFFGHCKMIKSFLLQGKGDFINLLLESMQDSLEVSASSIFRYNLVSLLDSTKAQISLSGYNKDYLGRLGIFLFDPTTGDKGWDIFSLKYELDSPLSTVFEPGIMKFYFTLFNHIWKMRNLIYLLNNSSKAYSRIFLQSAAPRPLIDKLEHFNRMRHQMLHFLNTFLSYLMLEVIETEWHVFLDAVKSTAESLDDIINRHRDFISAVMQKSMLSSKSNEMYKQLKELLRWIEMFTKTQNTHLLNIESNILPQRQSMVDEEERSVDFEAEADSSKAKDQRESFQIDAYRPAFKLIDEVWRNFSEGLDGFLQDLETDQKMKTLSFRLDFNEYYKMKRHVQGGRGRSMVHEKPVFKGHSDS